MGSLAPDDPARTTEADEQPSGSRWLAGFWRPPDPALMDAGASGEVVVAQIRLALISILVLIPLSQVVFAGGDTETYIGLVVSAGALLVALTVYLLVKRNIYRTWIGFATSVMDVSFISAVLIVFLVVGQPLTATNSHVVFPIYLLAVASTTLRYDPRVCIIAGLLAVTEYVAIVAFADWHWGLSAGRGPVSPYGLFSWGAQTGRSVVLASAGLLSTMVVLRARRLRWMAASDPLTMMMNRGFFDERLEEEALRARRYQRGMSILMIDIDHFKEFNDGHGHASGDAALRVVAEAIRVAVRRTDLVGRYGGEEFIVALPETGPAAATVKAEQLRRSIAAARIPLSRGPAATTTVSIGVGAWPEDGTDVRTIIEAADRRLYQAKQAGRNRAVGPGGPVPQA